MLKSNKENSSRYTNILFAIYIITNSFGFWSMRGLQTKNESKIWEKAHT